MTLSTSGSVMELSAELVATTIFTTPFSEGSNAVIRSGIGTSEWNGITFSHECGRDVKAADGQRDDARGSEEPKREGC